MINVSMTDKNGVTLATAGKYCDQNVKVTPSADILRKDEQEKSATPSTSSQDITPDAGMALSKVTVNPITPAIVGGLDAKTFAAAAAAAIEGKGVTVPDGTLLDGMAALIGSIEAGGGTGGGGGAESGEWACGTYTPSDTTIIGISYMTIETGLPSIRFFAFFRDQTVGTPTGYEYMAAVWDYNGGNYYGSRFASLRASSTSASVGGSNDNAMYAEAGTMKFKGLNTSTEVVAGNRYVWFAIGR